MLEYVHKEIKKNLKFINNKFLKFKKKIELNDGSCDIDYIEKKKNFSSPPFQYHSINYYKFKNSLKLKSNEVSKKKIKYLLRLQNKDGSFDEWYKNERSYCTSSYSSFLISNFILNNKIEDLNFKNELFKSIEKSFHFLKGKYNHDILNQNLAKLAFLQNYYFLKKKSKHIQLEFDQHLQKINRTILSTDHYEYGGIDLGYLTISIMLLFDILKKNRSKKVQFLFLTLIEYARDLTYGFNFFPNYIFSRSSRIFLISGFYFAYRQNIINKREFSNIFDFYKKNFKKFCLRKDLRYLSFFFSSDHIILHLYDHKKIIRNKTKFKKSRNIGLIYLNANNKKLFIYKKNPNLIAFYKKKKLKIILSDTIYFNKKKYLPTILEKINVRKDCVDLKISYVKINNYKNFIFNYVNLISLFSKINFINLIINKFSKYLLILRKNKASQFKVFKKIYKMNKKFIIRETIISKKRQLEFKTTYEINYFSPTSFLFKKETLKLKKIDCKNFTKMNKQIIKNTYEF